LIKVSVLVPTYNHAPYIEECIKGILVQKVNFEIEILIGDDESSDGTTEIIEKYSKIDNRITLVKGSRKNVIYVNGEVSPKRNYLELLKRSKGKYIAICEGDDYWVDEYKLQKQVNFLDSNEDYSICYTNSYIKNNEEITKSNKEKCIKTVYTIEDLLQENFIMTNTVVIRNDYNYDYLPKWFFEVSIICDWLLYVILLNEKKIKYLDIVTGVYRIHGGGIYSPKIRAYRLIDTYNILNAFNKYYNYKYNNIISEKKNDILLYIDNIFNVYNKKSTVMNFIEQSEEKLFEYIRKNIKGELIYIWGAGTHTENLIKLLKKYNFYNVSGIIDGNNNSNDQYKFGIKVINKDEFIDKYKLLCTDIIISSASFENEIYDEICNLKISKDINIVKLYRDERENEFKVLV
jgi:glycosyltransferase involved in cell wall biosynthesis